MSITPSLDKLVHQMQKLPGIGPKNAQRLALFIFKKGPEFGASLSAAIGEVIEKVRYCDRCFGICEAEVCPICSDPGRDKTRVCVVEKPTDVSYIENTGQFDGVYHVLNGLISPMDYMTMDKLTINQLIARLNNAAEPRVAEAVFALPPKIEGEATMAFIRKQILRSDIKITKLAQGIPTGCEIEHIDPITLARALSNRNAFGN